MFADTISLYTHDAVHSVAVLVERVVLYLAYFPDVQAEIQRLTDRVTHIASQIWSSYDENMWLSG